MFVADIVQCVYYLSLCGVCDRDRKTRQILCDGKLRCRGKDYPVHKCLLSTFSDYFKTMFRTEMRERYDDVIVLDHISHERMGNILEYLYTGYVDITEENVFYLLEDAEYTQIKDLKTDCTEYLMRVVCVENCLRTRAYAKRYNLPELLEKCRRTFSDDYSSLFNHADFASLEVDDIISFINDKNRECSEYNMFAGTVRWVQEDLASREELFPELFALIDLSLLTDEQLNDIRAEELVRNNIECSNRLVDTLGERVLRSTTDIKPKSQGSTTDVFDGLVENPSFVVIGGRQDSTKCHIYDTHTGQCRSLPDSVQPRYSGSAVSYGGKIFTVGGSYYQTFFTSSHRQVEVIDLDHPDAWTTLACLNEARRACSATVVGDCLYVCGGRSYSTFYASCEKYDFLADKWSNLPTNMTKKRAYHGAVNLNGELYCIGGSNGKSPLAKCEKLDVGKEEWINISSMADQREGLAAVELQGKIFAIGGFNGSKQLSTVECYDPVTDEWSYVAPLNVARSRHSACVVDGRIYVAGGVEEKSTAIKSIEVYDPSNGGWTLCDFHLKKANCLFSLVTV